MAFTRFTGKSATTVLAVDDAPMPGWRKVTIGEKGKPLPTPIDVTAAQDSVYTFVDDPLGGKTAANSTVTVEGLLSVTDHQDTGGWLALAIGTAYKVTVTTAAGGDEWEQASMVLKSFVTGTAVAERMPFTATFQHATASGAWATAS